MIWLTWRQHRRELLIVGVVLAALALYLMLTGGAMYSAYQQVTGGMSPALCERQQGQPASDLCNALIDDFYGAYNNNLFAMAALVLLPPLAGVFLGAPLVARELESGTFKLVWTQSVTRRRWLLTKVGAMLGVALLVSAATIPLVYWWRGPFSADDVGIISPVYAVEGVLPLAYMAFALALGIAAGTLLRRTVAAMFVTLAGYAAVAIGIVTFARQRFLPPLTATWNPFVSDGPHRTSNQDWVLYSGYLDQAGHPVDTLLVYRACAPDGHGFDFRPGSAFNACVQSHGWLSTLVWQPASRYWAFQGIESGLLVALGVALLALALWWVRSRLS
jgi:ABC-type transport system involved in multi-copper enzyme maturation permease subunit